MLEVQCGSADPQRLRSKSCLSTEMWALNYSSLASCPRTHEHHQNALEFSSTKKKSASTPITAGFPRLLACFPCSISYLVAVDMYYMPVRSRLKSPELKIFHVSSPKPTVFITTQRAKCPAPVLDNSIGKTLGTFGQVRTHLRT